MKLMVFIGNLVFRIINWWEYQSFLRNKKIRETQEKICLSIIRSNERSRIGKENHFKEIQSVKDFQQRLKITHYPDYQPYIDDIIKGEDQVITCERVFNLVPTSGTTNQKYIPYTPGLKKEFSRAINIWIFDLYKSIPELMWGRQFWIVSPQTPFLKPLSQVPIGFEPDSSYLGKCSKNFLRMIKAVPDEVAELSNEENYFYVLCYYLLACYDLKLISVWNPSLLVSIINYINRHFTELVNDIGAGTIRIPISTIKKDGELAGRLPIRESAGRASYLSRLYKEGDYSPKSLWPELVLISCWTDGWAKEFIPGIKELFPEVQIQGKGLLATEAVVSIPIGKASHPVLAYNVHFYEFKNRQNGKIFLAHELIAGEIYEAIVTTRGGLYRYALNDLIEVTGFYRGIPMMRFLGKGDHISDITGEKLNELQVSIALEEIGRKYFTRKGHVFLGAIRKHHIFSYVLFVEKGIPDPHCHIPDLLLDLDEMLGKNYHYLHSRKMKQLDRPGLALIDQEELERYFKLKSRISLRSTVKYPSLETDIHLLSKLKVDIKWVADEKIIDYSG